MVVLALLMAATSQAEERPPPDPAQGDSFDGRAHPPMVVQDYLVVPRLILAVPDLLLRLAVLPVGALARWLQRYAVIDRFADTLTTHDGLIGVRPSFEFVAGYHATFGLSFFDNKILGEGTALTVSADTDFQKIYIASVALRPTHIDRFLEYVPSVSVLNRDDYYYTGIGMTAAETHPGARYNIFSVEQNNRLNFVLTPHWFAHANGTFAFRRFGDGIPVGTDETISQVYCVRILDGRCFDNHVDPVQVPGFYAGTQFLRASAGMRFDTRDSFYRPTQGAALLLDVDYSHGLGSSDPSSYFRLHAVLEAVLDLWSRSRLLVLRASTNAVFPAGVDYVPFSELPVLATPDYYRGARWGKYRDFTTVLFTAEYRWPVWMWMDAALFTDYGAAFGRNYSGFQINRFLPDIGAALRLRTSSKFYIALQAAYGFNGDGFNFSFTGAMDAL